MATRRGSDSAAHRTGTARSAHTSKKAALRNASFMEGLRESGRMISPCNSPMWSWRQRSTFNNWTYKARRAWGASRGGDDGGELVLIFGLGEFVAEVGGFGAVPLRLLAVLNGAD